MKLVLKLFLFYVAFSSLISCVAPGNAIRREDHLVIKNDTVFINEALSEQVKSMIRKSFSGKFIIRETNAAELYRIRHESQNSISSNSSAESKQEKTIYSTPGSITNIKYE